MTTAPIIPWTPFIPHRPTPKQLAFLMLPQLEAMYGGAAGGGKVLERYGVVLTPFGFKKCIDLKIGDRINAPDGTTSRIIQLHPWIRIRGVKVSFHDGTSTVVAWDHLWLAWRSGKRKKLPNGESCFGESASEVIETRELAEWLKTAQLANDSESRANWPLIPVCREQVFNVQYKHRIELDPYQLGAWLGDGHWSTGGVGLTSADKDHTTKEFPDAVKRKGYLYSFTGSVGKHWKNQLARAGLKGAKAVLKFIPRQFLWGSVEDRWSILQGLMDTDGTVDDRGQLYFCSISKQLAQDVVQLVQSLGGTATIFEKNPHYRDANGDKVHCQLAYNVYIKLRDERKAFRLERKQLRCQQSPGPMYRRVVAVEEVEEIEGRCLSVSHPSGLYLTNDFIVTHNSDCLLMAALQHVDVPRYSAIIFRKSLSDLKQEDALITRAMEWLQPWHPYVKYVAEKHAFKFPSGATLAFGYIGEFRTQDRYQGAAYQFIGFDELTQHFEEDYLYLFSRLRAPKCKDHGGRIIDGEEAPLPDDPTCPRCQKYGPVNHLPLRMRSTCNPGGIGHRWVKDRFKINRHPDTGRWVGFDQERPFMPATIEDNPYLSLKEYDAALQKLDPLTREQLRYGNWGAPTNARFKPGWFGKYEMNNDTVVIERTNGRRFNLHRNSLQIFITIDPAASTREGIAGIRFHQRSAPSYGVISVWAVTPTGDLLWLDLVRMQTESPEFLQAVRTTTRIWRPSFVVCEAIGVGLPIYQMASSMGLPTVPLRTVPDKVANSIEAQVRAEQGKVFLPRDKPWLKEIEDEVFVWTGHPHETADIIDTFSNACHEVTRLAGEDQFDPLMPAPMVTATVPQFDMPVGFGGFNNY